MSNGRRQEPSQEVDESARAVIGAAIEVHRHLGPGYVENVYEEALALEMEQRRILYERQKSFYIDYKGFHVGAGRADFLVNGHLIVELKAVNEMHPVYDAQVISYLKATGLELGLLINFNVPVLKQGVKRVVLT